jgi:prolipoprotein diacylglyceryltransferase
MLPSMLPSMLPVPPSLLYRVLESLASSWVMVCATACLAQVCNDWTVAMYCTAYGFLRGS